MRELIDKLNYYTKMYDAGTPVITDKEFDELYFSLEKMEKETGIVYPDSPTQSISFEVVSNLDKVKHNHPMLSLPKSKDFEDIKNFINNRDYVAMTKCDGLTCSIRYINGELVSAETRGDGLIGEDILNNAKVMPSIPSHIPYNEELIVDGEVVCLQNDFLEFVDDYANPRNFAAGSIRLLDSKESSQRHLTFIAWEVIKGFEEVDSLTECFSQLRTLGFITVPHLHGITPEEEDIDIVSSMSSNIPKDGIVFKFNSRSYGASLGNTGHHLGNAIAFKMYDEEYESELINIEYETSRMGELTPVAVFKPIDIEGSEVSRASLSNLSIMKETLNKPWVGQKVWVTKRNMIIPHIEKAEEDDGRTKSYINDLAFCPICGQAVQRVTSASGVETLFCSNASCPSKIVNVIDHYCGRSGMDIKGLSKATIEKLLEWNWLGDITDIYTLSNHRAEWIRKPGFGVASVDKILNAIEESKSCTLDKFIVALGIPLIGPRAAKEIIKHFTNWTDFFNSIKQKFNYSTLPNFGYEISDSILNFNYSEAEYIASHYLNFETESKPQDTTLQDLTFCITGSVHIYKNRTELQNLITSLGGKVTGSVSKNTDYLINNDIQSNSSKNNSAQRLGVPIITEEEFQNLFEIS